VDQGTISPCRPPRAFQCPHAATHASQAHRPAQPATPTCCDRLAECRLRQCSAHSSATSHQAPPRPGSNTSAPKRCSTSDASASTEGGRGRERVGSSLGQRRRPRRDWRYWISWVTWWMDGRINGWASRGRRVSRSFRHHKVNSWTSRASEREGANRAACTCTRARARTCATSAGSPSACRSSMWRALRL